jgi:N-acetyl-gamma-glutamyl-phosphate reductase
MKRVGVIGASGYAGAELVRILRSHPQVELACLTCRQDAGQTFDTVYPALSGWIDLVCEAYDPDKMADAGIQVAFTALPHQLPMAIVPELLNRGIQVVDLSADFRFKDAATYEAFYQPHSCPELLEKAVYGLAEVYADEIRAASLVGNPGCYPTSVLMPLIPLLASRLIESQGIIADAKSGVSGAGRSASAATHFCHVNESFKAYKVASHRHTPEMEAILKEKAGQPVPLIFVPHLVPMTRGMQSSIYAVPKDGVTESKIGECLTAFYKGRPFVRLRGQQPPDTLHVKGTNCIDMSWKIDPRQGRLILMSAIDNLVKGAAGQAVQNMNLILGLDETAGLDAAPYPL